MTKVLQFVAVFLDLGIASFFILALLFTIVTFFQQVYIRMRCKYRGFKEKPGRACVICDYQGECYRAWKSREYERYFFCRISHPDQAQTLFDEIQAEEEAKSK